MIRERLCLIGYVRVALFGLSLLAVNSFIINGTLAFESGKETDATRSKAIEAAEMEKGFRLGDRAAVALEIHFAPVEGDQILAESGGLIHFLVFTGVYRRRDGWIRMVEIDGTKAANGKVLFSSKEFRPGDEIAIQGASALRVIDMDLWGPKADACGD